MKMTLILSAAISALSLHPQAEAQQAAQGQFALLREAVANNQAALKEYSWTEQANAFLKGELKKTTVYQCQYGPSGEVERVPMGGSPPPPERRGVRGRVVERKSEELESYMREAGTLMKLYVPPKPGRLDAGFHAGDMSIGQLGPGTVQLIFRNYVKPGDSLVLTLDLAAKVLIRSEVNTYMNDPSDIVTLKVDFQTLPNGPNYAAQTTLDAPAKKIQIQTTSSNYRRLWQ
jgi:hypothetical protein